MVDHSNKMSLMFKLGWSIAIIAISVFCGTPTTLILFYLIGRGYVLSTLSPPDYPGSEIINQESGGGSGGTWVKTIYDTTDSQDKVLSFMEARMPGFALSETKDPLRTAPIYSNSSCAYETHLGRYFYSRGYYPCKSLSIYPDGEVQARTLIEVFEWYPDH